MSVPKEQVPRRCYSKSALPDRLELSIGSMCLIYPDQWQCYKDHVLSHPIGPDEAKKQRCVWTGEGIIELEPAKLAQGTRLYAAPVASQKTASHHMVSHEGSSFHRRAGTCFECGHICYEEGNEAICSKCGLVQEWGEPTSEDSIRLMFTRFDLLEVSKGLLRPIPQPGGKTPRLFLGMKQTHYYKSIDGQNKTIDCSILDRERGYKNEPGDLPEELSYPALCVLTFYDIPHIADPPLPGNVNVKGSIIIYEEYNSSELAKINVKTNELYGTIYPTTAKTIKKNRDLSINKPGVVPYCHKKYEGTPIGKLLEEHPTSGRAALDGIFNYFMMFFFEHYSLPENAPTRQNIIKSFMNGPKLRGAEFPKVDLAEYEFGLLKDYGIIKDIEGNINKNHGLYYATQKSGPHQIPTGAHNSTREHYILNNKS